MVCAEWPRRTKAPPRRPRTRPDAAEGYTPTTVYARERLGAGDTFCGPAIVEEFGSTVPVHPGFQVRVDAWGNLVITKPGGGVVAGTQQQEEQA